MSGNPAILDEKKLRSVNAVYLRRKSPEELADLAAPTLVESGVVTEEDLDRASPRGHNGPPQGAHRAYDRDPRLRRPLLRRLAHYDEAEFEKQFGKEFCARTSPSSSEASQRFPGRRNIERKRYAASPPRRKVRKHLIHPLRFAVTGRTVSAGLFETMQLLGRERSLLRAGDAAEKMQRLPV